MISLPATLILASMAALTSAQNPTAVVPMTNVPIIVPTGTSLAGAVITSSPDGNNFVMAVQCLDDICSGDPAATASWSIGSEGTGSYTWAWTAKNDPLNSTSYGCALTTDLNAKVPCTVAFPSGLTASASQYSSYPMASIAAPFPTGIGAPVNVTSGAALLPASSLTCGASACNANQLVTPGGDGPAPTSGAGSASSAGGSSNGPASASASSTMGMQSSASAGGSSSASSTAQATGGAATIASRAGAALAAVAFVGAVAL